MLAYSHKQESSCLDQAMTAFRVAVTCESSSISARCYVEMTWARHTESRHESAIDAYRAAIDFLPRMAMLGLDLQSRQRALIGSNGWLVT
jgi:hypothetical protein